MSLDLPSQATVKERTAKVAGLARWMGRSLAGLGQHEKVLGFSITSAEFGNYRTLSCTTVFFCNLSFPYVAFTNLTP